MARYGPADVDFSFNGSSVPDVTVIGDASLESIMEEITPFGSAWETHDAVGVKRLAEFDVEAPYSDDNGNLEDVCMTDVGVGSSAAVVLTYGGSKTTSFTAFVVSANRVMDRGVLTKFRARLRPTSTITEA